MRRSLLLVTLSTIAFLGCKNTTKQDAGLDSPEETLSKPVVYVSNYPLYYFASRIGGDRIELRFPAAALNDPSGWSPPADTVAAMQQADLILLNGASYEGWLMNVSLSDSLLTDTSAGFSDKLLPSGETFTHSHGAEGEHAHEGTASTTWLDLSLAGLQAEAVKNALSRTQPAWEGEYETNYKALASEIGELDRAFKETVNASAAPRLVYSHPVYQYFQNAYELKGQSLHWEPDTPLDHDMLHEIGHLKKDYKIKHIVWEHQPLPESAKKLTDMGIESVVIDPTGGMPESGDFMDGIYKNLEALKKAIMPQL